MIEVQITTPVLPNVKMQNKLIRRINEITKDEATKVKMFEEGKDFYGHVNFQVLVMDATRHELDELRNEVYCAILTMLFGNKK